MLSFGEVQTARDWFKGVPGTESFADVPQSLSIRILSSVFPIHVVALNSTKFPSSITYNQAP